MRFAVLAALIAVISCTSALESGPNSLAGTYVLVRVDDRALPAPIATGFTVRGTLELKGEARYTLSQSDSTSGGGVSTTSVSGRWTVENNALQMVQDGNILQLGIFILDTVRTDYRSHENVYVRR
jgi:hypothetical protein